MTAERWTVRTTVGAGACVRAEIDGSPVEVHCTDLPLLASPEAWCTAFALPAARAGAVLAVDEPVDARWLAGARRNATEAATWWGGGPLHLEASRARRRRRTGTRAGHEQRDRDLAGAATALCFTGGVDSFHTLLADVTRPTHLLFVIGFDVDLDDAERARSVEAAVRDTADRCGLGAVIVRTDLRHHPRFAALSWEHTHGAALAAVGLLLAPGVRTLVIPPSYAAHRLVPWGSHPELDPRWSVPGRLEVQHADATGTRSDRVRAIAQHPLVHEHLRVCWQNVDRALNCGRCEKCVRTMAMLAAAGSLDRCRTLPDRRHLIGAIDGLAPLAPGTAVMWDDLRSASAASHELSPEEESAIDRLLARSAAATGPD